MRFLRSRFLTMYVQDWDACKACKRSALTMFDAISDRTSIAFPFSLARALTGSPCALRILHFASPPPRAFREFALREHYGRGTICQWLYCSLSSFDDSWA